MVRMNFFLDTNVFIDWALLKHVFKSHPNDIDKYLPFHKKIRSSWELLELIKKHNIKNTFFTSPFSIAEFSQAIIRQAVMRALFVENIPFNFFEKYKKEILNKTNTKKGIYRLLDEIYISFIKSNLVTIKTSNLLNDTVLASLDYLQIDCGLSTPDAIIFLDAVINKAEYFVTSDRDFFDNKKKLKNFKNLKIIKPKEALELVKKQFK